jgi:phosphatidylglycerophosphatase A
MTPRWLKLFVTFGGAGLSPKAPGTMGTLAALPLAALTLWAGPLWHMGGTLLLTIFSIWACEMYERQKGGHDHQEIVIDEVIGLLITVTLLPLTWQTLVAGFVVFRFFDILKPFPISLIDKKVMGGVGVVADDVAAGIVANLILQWVYGNTFLLGAMAV